MRFPRGQMNKKNWNIRNLTLKFFLGDNSWAHLRLWVIIISLLLWAAVLSYITGIPLTLHSWVGLRYLLAPLFSIVYIFLLSARYVQDIYNLENYSTSLHYVLASFLGLGYPMARIDKGRKDPATDKLGLLDKIGGPGFLRINPGNVVLLERLQSPSAVCGSGIHFISRFDRIKEIVDLEEQQFDSAKLIQATSKDGIPIVVSNVRFRYILSPGPNRVRTISDLYPYSVQAVRHLAYNRAVGGDGRFTFWEKAVQSVIEGVISSYINEHQVDQITAPRYLENDPRYEISALIRSAGTRSRLKNIGTELTWFDIGSVNVGEEVDLQRLKAWQATWKRRSSLTRAQGEAQRIAYQELGRVETQSDLLKGILKSFSSITPCDKHKENVRKIVMARTAQILESMTSLYQNADEGLVSGIAEPESQRIDGRTGTSGQNEDKENI